MIVRTWRGRAAKSRPDDYKRHFEGAVLPELHRLDGFLGSLLLRRETADDLEILVITRWASLDAIKSFAGEDHERAVVEPGAIAALESFDATVTHYEVIAGDDS
jgi:heme-degrading monooxygenase HmoA